MRPDISYLHERLRYEAETGRFYWRHYEPHGPLWNARWAGREAFTSVGGRGYRQGTLDGRKVAPHRVAWAMSYGEWPADDIDHEDHTRTNNRLGNLRVAGKIGNGQNLSRARNNTSGAVGVCWNIRLAKWHARITVRRRVIHLGYFDDFNEAAQRRKEAEIKHGFHPNHGAAQ